MPFAAIRRVGSFGLLCLLIAPVSAAAHGLAIYASTPVTPPLGFLWVPLLFVLLLTAWDCWVVHSRIASSGFLRIVQASLICTVIWFTVFVLLGSMLANSSTAPYPGLGPPDRALYGMPWMGRVGRVFVIANASGIALFFLARMAYCLWLGLPDRRSRLLLLAGSLGLYLVSLVPYVVAHAPAYGWAGVSAAGPCVGNVHNIKKALAAYVKRHDQRLPSAANIVDVLAILSQDSPVGAKSILMLDCPVESLFTGNPVAYQWNATFAGARLPEIPPKDWNDWLVRCGGEHWQRYPFGNNEFLRDWFMITIADLRESVLSSQRPLSIKSVPTYSFTACLK